jgi:hypothetical protein
MTQRMARIAIIRMASWAMVMATRTAMFMRPQISAWLSLSE